MVREQRGKKTILARTLENILFLAEVFSEKTDYEVPDVPILELARNFELSHPRIARATRRPRKQWTLWD